MGGINPIKILPKKTKQGFNIYSKVNGTFLKTWYILPSNKRKIEFTFPRHLRIDKEFICALALSIGEGLNNPNKRNIHYNFANTNIKLVKLVYDWLTKNLGINKNSIRTYANIPEENSSNKDLIIQNLVLQLDIPKESIRGYLNKRNRKVCVMLQISNSLFQSFYLNLFDKLKGDIIRNREYRISFLNGLFAAEGHVKHSVYGTVENVGFAFNPKVERLLAEFLKHCLALEGIKSRIDEKKGYLYILGYKNMLRVFLLGIINLNEEKREKFIRLIKNADVYAHVNKGLLDKLQQFSQLELSRELKVSQPLISLWRKENRIKLSILAELFCIFGMPKREFTRHIRFLKIANSKVSDRNAISFLLSLHDFKRGSFKIKVGRVRKRSNKSALFSILKDAIASSGGDKLYLESFRKNSHLSKITIQQWLKKLKDKGFVRHTGIKGHSKVYVVTKKGLSKYKGLSRLYKML